LHHGPIRHCGNSDVSLTVVAIVARRPPGCGAMAHGMACGPVCTPRTGAICDLSGIVPIRPTLLRVCTPKSGPTWPWVM
jgi:hypothetical protein